MTNLEALQANISGVHGLALTENHFKKALLDEGLQPIDYYRNSAAIDRATLRICDILIANAQFSEGSLSYSPDMSAVKLLKEDLLKKLGRDTSRTVTGVSPW